MAVGIDFVSMNAMGNHHTKLIAEWELGPTKRLYGVHGGAFTVGSQGSQKSKLRRVVKSTIAAESTEAG